MHIAILTFDGFNELDSLIAYGMLGRIKRLGDADWRVSIASPTARVTSMNGLTVDAHIGLAEACQADAVLIGSDMKTREVAANDSIMGLLQLDPGRQLIAAQCSGTFLLAKLGLLRSTPACTDNTSKEAVSVVRAAGEAIVGHERCGHPTMTCGAEDFSYFLQQKPGAFFFVGCALPGQQTPSGYEPAWDWTSTRRARSRSRARTTAPGLPAQHAS
jgi:putative intracellular protease/amidase